MTDHRHLILKKLEHLERMAGYLEWSLDQVKAFVPIRDWDALTAEQHESLAAFRIRFSEFQEHLGKVMRAVAIAEETPSLTGYSQRLMAYCRKHYRDN